MVRNANAEGQIIAASKKGKTSRKLYLTGESGAVKGDVVEIMKVK